MNTRPIPAIIMLIAGFITCIITMIQKFTVNESLIVLLISLISFYIIGGIIKKILDYFLNPPKVESEEEAEAEKQEEENNPKSSMTEKTGKA